MPYRYHFKILWFVLLIVLYGCFELVDAFANQYKFYPNLCIKKLAHFRFYYDEIFQIVADKMGLEVNDKIEKPKIFTDDQITLLHFNRHLGWEASKIHSYYFQKTNTIVIPFSCKLDSLVEYLLLKNQYRLHRHFLK